MKNKRSFWTLRFALINILYFSCFCTVHAFASVYLLDRGFTNTQIGILLALANVISALAQPFIAGLIDQPGFFTNRIVTIICSGIILFGSLLLILTSNIKLIVFIVFALIYMIQFAYQPILTSLSFEYQAAGCNIFFGLARGLGSAGFAVTSAFIGNAVEAFGVRILLFANIFSMLLLIIIAYFFKKPDISKMNMNSDNTDNASNIDNNLSVIGFIKAYPSFLFLLLAVILLFFGHNMLNDYAIQIIRNVGGSESDLGYATFLAAMLELPAMSLVSIYIKKIPSNTMLIFSGIFFTIKALIMLFATNMFLVYLSQAMQFFAYAILIPASAYYVSENISESDQVKGQAFITACFTLGGVFSSLVCGTVLDLFGVKQMLIIGCLVSAIGSLVMIKAVNKR